MRLKSFHAKTLTEAMNQVRNALGDDAIIVATRDEPGGVRVTAALDDNPASDMPMRDRRNRIEQPPLIDDDNVIEKVTDVLLRHGAPARVTEAIISAVVGQDSDTARAALIDALQSRFNFTSLEKVQKPILLVGPPGMGKTLTAAKLAAQAVMAKKKISVFSTDVTRAGGIEQLEAFTRLMQIDLMTAESGDALADGLISVSSEIKIIDSAGCNPFDMTELSQLSALIKECGGVQKIEPVLVMAAGGDAIESAEIAAIFHELGANLFIPTRLDISRRLGGVLSAAERANLKFASSGISANVADGLSLLTPEKLADLLLGQKDVDKNTKANTR